MKKILPLLAVVLAAAIVVVLARGGGRPSAEDAVRLAPMGSARPPASEVRLEPGGAGAEEPAAGAAAETTDAARAPAPAGAGAPAPGGGVAGPVVVADPEPADAAPAVAGTHDGEAILRRAAAAYRDVRSLQAEFTQRLTNPILQRTTTSRGTLYQRSPDRFLMRFSEPEGDVIVSDGEHFWVYYPSADPRQVLRSPAAAGAGAVDLQAQFVGDPVERFDFTLEGAESVGGRDAHVLTLVPRQRGAGYRSLKVWLDGDDHLARRFEITEDNGTVRRFDLSGLRLNPDLPDGLFRFTPPADARIVDR